MALRTTQLQYVPLRRRFMLHMLTCGVKEFTTLDAKRWYSLEVGKDIPYGNLYVVLLKPLLMEGKIGRLSRGLWFITQPDEYDIQADIDRVTAQDLEQDDDWDRYIRQKLYTPDPHRGITKENEDEV